MIVRMISIVLTAWREEATAGKAAEALISSAKELSDEFEFILVCPDEPTRRAVEAVVDRAMNGKLVYIRDPQKGKPHALNLAFAKASGEIIVSTDGDVIIKHGALQPLLAPLVDKKIGGVTGRPVCANNQNDRWGYWGHLLIDAAHQKREETLSRGKFFALSGYLLAVRNIGWKIPDGVLDDVYLSYKLREDGYELAYVPDAEVLVRQPSSLDDWMKQKVRSVRGYQGLKKEFPRSARERSFWQELKFALYPLRYARNVREFFWSLLLYPMRAYMWLAVVVASVRGKTATEIWGRVQTTK